MEFCKSCEQLLKIKKNPDKNKYEYFCSNNICKEKFSEIDKEILYIKKNIQKNPKVKLLVESGIQDDTFPAEKKECQKCKRKTMKYFRLDYDLKKVYICEVCGVYYT